MNDIYKKLKEQVERRYQESLKLAEKQRIARLEALDDLLEISQEKEPMPAAKRPTPARPKLKRYGGLTDTVKKALALVPRKFTKQDIKLVWPQASSGPGQPFNLNSLAGCLIRLEKQGLISKIKRGSGSIPSQYKKNEGLFKEG